MAECMVSLTRYFKEEVRDLPSTKRVIEAGFNAMRSQLEIEKTRGLVFRDLESGEEEKFRQWARDNFKKGEPASNLWHPAVRDEWKKLEEAQR